jgi:hypothetical protein
MLGWTLGLLLWMAACAPPAPQPSPTVALPTATTPPQEARQVLADKLRGAGFDVEVVGPVERPALGTTGQRWRVGGQEIEVYQFADEAALHEVVSQMSPDGQTIGGQALGWSRGVRLWRAGELLVAYTGDDGGTILLLSGLLGDALVEPPAAGEEPYPPAVVAAIRAAADWLGVSPAEVVVVDFQAVQWSDSCLGVKKAGEYCLQVITPGWRVTLRGDGREVRVHTDERGSQVRVVP